MERTLGDSYYRDWLGEFYEGAYYVTDSWGEGSEIMFLVPDQSGIFSLIEIHIPNPKIQFKHLGSVLNGKVQAMNEDTKRWLEAQEIYYLSKKLVVLRFL